MLRIKLVAIGLVSAWISFAQGPEEKGIEIAKEADKRDTGWGNSSNELTMTLTNKNGQKTTRQMHGYNMEVDGDGDKSMIIFDTPADVKGTASMTYTHRVGDDDQWLYLPALARVKRISSSNKSGPFMGSEFAFEDLSSQEVEKYTYKYIRDEKVNGIDCYLVERYPVAKSSGYQRQEVWFNKSNYRTEKVVYYDRKNSLLKTLTFSDYEKYLGKYWRANQMHMVNHQNHKETLLRFTNYEFKVAGISEASFTQNSLKRAK